MTEAWEQIKDKWSDMTDKEKIEYIDKVKTG
jgi:hypothetical protein